MATEDDRVRIRVAEILSSGGVGFNQVALQALYMLPSDFIHQYEMLFEVAMGPPVKAPGDALGKAGELGKAKTQGKFKGTERGVGQSGGGTKRLRKIFGVRNEPAFRLKDKIDKRLRAIARDIRSELALMDEDAREAARAAGVVVGAYWGTNRGSDSHSQSHSTTNRCQSGGHMMAYAWSFCPIDGSPARNESLEVDSAIADNAE